ncbi:MAG: hypothetical protein MK212_02025 [Saprospiraceae bacterium]|nr:hypothetical protein [Saprospiraceae bacterium]
MRILFSFLIIITGYYYSSAQYKDSVIQIKEPFVAVLMELPYEWCLVASSPCGLFHWQTTLKYRLLYPVEDTILVQFSCPYESIDFLQTGKLVQFSLGEEQEPYRDSLKNTYENFLDLRTYSLKSIRRKVNQLKKKGLDSKRYYRKKYSGKIQKVDTEKRSCACCQSELLEE